MKIIFLSLETVNAIRSGAVSRAALLTKLRLNNKPFLLYIISLLITFLEYFITFIDKTYIFPKDICCKKRNLII